MRFLALALATLCLSTAWAADPIVVSAASPAVGVAPDSLATIFGDKLSTVTESASLPWPTSLGDISVVYVVDSTSQMRMAPISFVSPSQINIWIPPQTAPGPATVEFPFTGLPPGVGAAALRIVPVTIENVAPGLFSVDGRVAAASAVRVVAELQSPVPVYICDAVAKCSAVPIDVGVDTPVFLSLYGTGIRRASSLSQVVVAIGSTKVQPTYAGPQPQIPGLDQVNVPLPLTLRGSGLVNVTVAVEGVVSNAVQINIQ